MSDLPPTSLRPLLLQHNATRVSVPVSAAQQDWTAAELARDSFHDALEQPDADYVGFDDAVEGDDDADPAAKDEAEREREMVLLAHFVEHLVQQPSSTLQPAYDLFVATYLDGTDIHTLAARLTKDVQQLVIRAFFKAKVTLGAKSDLAPLLVDAGAGKANVYALFGGQGMNEVYFDELQTLFNLYSPLLTPFLTLASSSLSALASANQATQLYNHSLSPISWLTSPSTRPSTPYLASCAVSLPLIGLTQLSQYLVYGLSSGLSPHAFGALFKGATGHSQGVVSACVVARKYPADGQGGWQPFYDAAVEGLEVLFQIGLQGSLFFPTLAVSPQLVASSIENGEGVPTPMLAVTGLEKAKLEKKIDEVNKFLDAEGARGGSVSISLLNGPKAFVVTGKPGDLVGLADGLRKGRAPQGKDQSKTPYSKRLPVFSTRFLPIGVPYHSPLLTGATDAALSALSSPTLFTASQLSYPVYHTADGSDLRESADLTKELFDQIFTSPIHWASHATNFPKSATHAIDFGTGGASGIGSLCVRNWEGRGIRTIMLGNRATGEGWGKVVSEERWEEKFRPRLVKDEKGRTWVDTKMSRMLGKPPVMVAGMTPSTVKAGFVSAVLKAGYHIELAGGGHYNEKAIRSKVAEISKLVNQPGVGVTLNCLYINQRQWTFQLPLWQQMKKEGLPVEGLCVAAGIPSTEKAKEIIDGLTEAGIKHVSFKPGSVDGIRQVVNIAAANPHFPILLQWTGGRAGGHHSCEDFHAPLLATYASIRSKENIILVGGSGFGADDASDVWPYLTGEWSEAYGVSKMPFDGFLYASRVMVAKEAHTSEGIKQLIVDAPGVGDSQWEQTYDKPTGGIMTVTSELGEPIHKVATRGVKLWAEFDKTVFALPREKQEAWLKNKKQYVIDRLNKDFQKPWFGAKSSGKSCDLDEMTYSEVNARLVRLMYVAHENRWVDPSLRNLVGDWIRRVEERLSNVNEGGVKVSVLQSYQELEQPQEFLEKFEAQYPAAKDQILASADVAYFLAISQRPGQKPVPFIPILDGSFSVWFKKDSLWQSEDLQAVFDQDPQRVCILQGPMAVKHCTTTQQPIGDFLDGISNSLAKNLLEKFYSSDESSVPSIAYLAAEPAPVDPSILVRNHIAHTVEKTASGGEKHIYNINGVLPPTGDWLDTLAGPKLGWLQAFLSNVSITHGQQTLPNPVKRVLAPRHGQRVELSLSKDGQPEKLDVFGGL
ncbi:fatty acid synthase subunit beta [Pseudohyphozyma bogoriensis]|nr:fatty acid synthase subunit beta [Pseudohyphozyma bogoriensis]